MREYMLVLGREERETLGAVRCLPNLEVAEDEYLYVRGIDESTIADKRIKQLPALHTYWLDPEQRYFLLQGVTPVGKLKLQKWVPINKFISIELPVSAMPGRLQKRLDVKLVKADNYQDGYALLTSIDILKAYAESAPAIRLEALQFAVSENGDVLITGNPLPAIQGKEYYKENDVLLPAGHAFEVPLVGALLQRKLNAEKDSVLLFKASGEWQKIPRTSFVHATRSAIRSTNISRKKW